MNYYLSVLKNYAAFSGRARRSEYWYFFLFNLIISIGLGVIGGLIGFVLLSSVYSLAVLIPSFAVAVRRLHDAGKSGWFIFIPFYNLILLCTDSEAGENKYGPNPKDPASALPNEALDSVLK